LKRRERLKGEAFEHSEPIYFAAAKIYAREIEVKKKPVRLTGGHRGQMATAKNGYIVIEKRWFKK
jgi:hypothetical protein